MKTHLLASLLFLSSPLLACESTEPTAAPSLQPAKHQHHAASPALPTVKGTVATRPAPPTTPAKPAPGRSPRSKYLFM
jgi:hypothetical protein